MATIIGISGSLREKSINSALLRAAADLSPEGLHVEIADLRGIAEGMVPAACCLVIDRSLIDRSA